MRLVQNQEKDMPIFTLPEKSLRYDAVWLIAFALFAYFAYDAYQTGSGIINVLWTSFVAAAFLDLLVHPWFYPIKKARFYETYVELVGRKESSVLLYSDFDTVRKVRVFSFRDPFMQIHITTKRDEQPLRIFGNPTSKQLKTDLYSWLSKKVKEQVESTHRF
jgi:hypothetical protein